MTDVQVAVRVREMRKLLVDAMRREHNANSYKGGWRGRGTPRHVRDIYYHVAKLDIAMRTEDDLRSVEYAADVCNHVLFALDDMLTEVLEESIIQRNFEAPYIFPGRRFYLRLMLRHPRYASKCLDAILKGHTDYEGAMRD